MWGITIQFCMNVWNEEGKQAYSLYLFFIVFAIPLVQITGSYAFIIRTLYTRRIPSVGGKNGSIALNQSRKYKTGSTRNGNGSVHAPRTSSVYVANSTSKLNRNSTRNKEAEIRQVILFPMQRSSFFSLSSSTFKKCYNFLKGLKVQQI